jgi:hypothetical protein
MDTATYVLYVFFVCCLVGFLFPVYTSWKNKRVHAKAHKNYVDGLEKLECEQEEETKSLKDNLSMVGLSEQLEKDMYDYSLDDAYPNEGAVLSFKEDDSHVEWFVPEEKPKKKKSKGKKKSKKSKKSKGKKKR